MRVQIYMALMLFSFVAYSQKDTTWYDKDWKPVERDKALFYRLQPQKVGDRFLYLDYYKNGTRQGEGYSMSDTAEIWDGDVKFFDNKGRLKALERYLKGKPYGVAERYDQNGKITATYTYIDGTDESKFQEFDKEGKLRYEINYKNGKKNGEQIMYHPNGQIAEKATNVNDTLEGYAYRYSEEGKLMAKNFSVKGVLNGEWIEYYDNGSVRGKVMYLNGKPNGKLISYYKKGGIEYTETYKDGVKDGPYVSYWQDGKTEQEGNYEKDERVGTWKFYNSNGKLDRVVPSDFPARLMNYRKAVLKIKDYNNISKDGEFVDTYKNGTKAASGEIVNGMKEGKWEYFDSKGNILLEENYVTGKLDGDQYYYNSNGAKIKEIPWKEGNLHGMVVEWDEKGDQAILNLFFMNGKELYDRTEFYDKFYSKGVKTKGNVQIINLDELEESPSEMDPEERIEEVRISTDERSQEPYVSSQNKKMEKIKMDTISNQDGVLILSKMLTLAQLNSHTKVLDTVLLNIHYTRDGSYILDKYHNYTPKENEILFLYEDNTGDFSGQQINFRIGFKIKKALANKSLSGIEVVDILENGVFDAGSFPGMITYEQLMQELK